MNFDFALQVTIAGFTRAEFSDVLFLLWGRGACDVYNCTKIQKNYYANRVTRLSGMGGGAALFFSPAFLRLFLYFS